MKRLFLGAIASLGLLVLAACNDASVTANPNLDRSVNNFEILRTVSFYNTWIDTIHPFP